MRVELVNGQESIVWLKAEEGSSRASIRLLVLLKIAVSCPYSTPVLVD